MGTQFTVLYSYSKIVGNEFTNFTLTMRSHFIVEVERVAYFIAVKNKYRRKK